MRHMSPASLTPNPHLVRILLCVCLDWSCHTSVTVTLAEDGVHSTAKDGCVAGFDRTFFVICWFVGVEWNIVAFGTEFCDACIKLGDRGRDVGEFDYDCFRLEASIRCTVIKCSDISTENLPSCTIRRGKPSYLHYADGASISREMQRAHVQPQRCHMAPHQHQLGHQTK